MAKENTSDQKSYPQVRVVIAPDGLQANACIEPDPAPVPLPEPEGGPESGPEGGLAPTPAFATSVESGSESPPVVHEGEPAPVIKVSPGYVMQQLFSFGIKIGIDRKAVETLVDLPRGEYCLVAQGIPATPGQDGYIEVKFQEETDYRLPTDSTQKIDWRGLVSIPTVKSGDVLAIKRPPKPGKDGLSVTGQRIPAPATKEAKLATGKGCAIVGGEKVVATINGQPAISRGRVSVTHVLIRRQGVNMETGNVVFDGAVVVNGNVEENMVVKAGTDIDIKGNVSHATLVAAGQIIIRRNLVGGSVRAGERNLLHFKHHNQWELLAKGLGSCNGIILKIIANPEFTPVLAKRGWVPVFQELINSKFADVRNVIRVLQKNYSSAEAEQAKEALTILEPLVGLLTTSTGLGLSIEGFSELVQKTEYLVESLKDADEKKSTVTVYSVQGARIEAGGDIIITGPGCYQSQLWAGQTVQVKGHSGIVRGGSIRAKETIEVVEAGSKAGVPTLLQVGLQGVIKIKTAHPNVQIKVGKMGYKFNATEGLIAARIDKEGQLVMR